MIAAVGRHLIESTIFAGLLILAASCVRRRGGCSTNSRTCVAGTTCPARLCTSWCACSGSIRSFGGLRGGWFLNANELAMR